jgi:hypothetical protein
VLRHTYSGRWFKANRRISPPAASWDELLGEVEKERKRERKGEKKRKEKERKS